MTSKLLQVEQTLGGGLQASGYHPDIASMYQHRSVIAHVEPAYTAPEEVLFDKTQQHQHPVDKPSVQPLLHAEDPFALGENHPFQQGLKQAAERLAAAMMGVESYVQQLQKQLRSAQEETHDRGIEESKLMHAVEKWQQRFRSADEERSNLQQMLIALKTHYENLQKENATLKQALEEAEERHERIERDHVKLRALNAALQQQTEHSIDTREAVQAEISAVVELVDQAVHTLTLHLVDEEQPCSA